MRGDMWTRAARAAVVLLLSAAIAGCGNDSSDSSSSSTSSDQPAVCASIEDLTSSLADVKAVDLSADGVGQLQTALEAVKADFDQVKQDASAEISSKVDIVTTDLATLEADLTAAKETPNATTLGAVGTSVKTLVADVTTLVDDIGSTC